MRVGSRYKGRYNGAYSFRNSRKYRVNLYKFRFCKKNNKIMTNEINNIAIIIGRIIVIFGLFLIFKNTMIYSGAGISRGIMMGTSCGLAVVLLMIGFIITLCNKNSFIGWSLISIGVLLFFIGIIINLKMMFMPINLLSGVILFGIVAFGIAIIIKGTFGKIR